MNNLLSALHREGLVLVPSTGSDARGEEAKLRVVSEPYTVQFVTVPSATAFWREATIASAQTVVTVEQAVGWIRTAIVAKHQNT